MQLPDGPVTHSCPNIWVNGCEIELNCSFEMVLLIESQIIFFLLDGNSCWVARLRDGIKCVRPFCL